jgi:hypothetical protein
VVPAYDFTTGQQYMAPPIPYGHYAKDYLTDGHLGKGITCLSCLLHGHGGCFHCLQGLCQHLKGSGHGCCLGLFGHHGTPSCGIAGCPGGFDCGHAVPSDAGIGTAVVGPGPAGPSVQAITQPSAQLSCGPDGCTINRHHGYSGQPIYDGSYGDPGCGPGRGHCGLCGGKGCLHCLGKLCGFCGGKGCLHCLAGLGAGLHGKLGSLVGLLHHPHVTYFVGAGGPVPLTPGYVPYIVVTRSPREYFAFPPMNPNDP